MTDASKTQPWANANDFEERLRKVELLVARVVEQFKASESATRLQAEEYKRRLHELNGEYKRDRERQQDFVSMDKYEDKISAMDEARITAVQAEKEAREAALLRIDEKFDEYVRKWEQIQGAQAEQIVTLTAAAAEAKRIAEDQGRQTRSEADKQAQAQEREAEKKFQKQQLLAAEQARKTTRVGIAIAATVTLVVAIANGVGPF